MSHMRSAKRRNRIGGGRVTDPKDHAVVGRLLPDYLSLVMLASAWRLSDGDDFAVLWCVSRAVAESTDEKQLP